jgi:hypothetical protein
MAKFNLTNKQNIANQSKLILKGLGLGLLKPKFYNIDQTKVSKEQEYEDTLGVTGNLSGMQVFDAVIFKKPAGAGNQIQTFVPDSRNTGLITANDLVLEVALITATQEKNIVKTAVQGRNGTIKEYVSDGDWQISIRGVIVGELSNKRPSEELKKLDLFRGYNAEIDVISNFLDDLKVYTVVITNVTYEQREGMRNVYDYTLTCLSETPFEIKSNA